MANIIQIKRSTTTAIPPSLNAGELAYTSNGDILWLGSPNNSIIPIAGFRVPGTLTANQALVANTTSGLNLVIAANVNVLSYLSVNGSVGSAGQTLLSGGPSANAYYGSPVAAPAGANLTVQFNLSGTSTGNTELTFDPTLNGGTLAIGNATVNTTTNSTVFSGTANNATNLGGTAAFGYQTTAGLAANVLTLTSNNSTNFAGQAQAFYANVTSPIFTTSTTVGNSTVNNFSNSTASVIGNTTVNSTLSSTSLSTGTGTFGGNVTISGANVQMTSSTLAVLNAVISGNLTVSGTMTTIDTSTLKVNDNLIQMADAQANTGTFTDAVDFGFFGQSGNTSVSFYSGIARVAAASTNTNPYFVIFETTTLPNNTIIDTAYNLGTLRAYVNSAAFVSNSTVVNITANSSISVALVANSLTLTTALPGTSGGTGLTSVAAQTILVGNATNGFTNLALGANGYVLQMSAAGVVQWNVLDGGTF